MKKERKYSKYYHVQQVHHVLSQSSFYVQGPYQSEAL